MKIYIEDKEEITVNNFKLSAWTDGIRVETLTGEFVTKVNEVVCGDNVISCKQMYDDESQITFTFDWCIEAGEPTSDCIYDITNKDGVEITWEKEAK